MQIEIEIVKMRKCHEVFPSGRQRLATFDVEIHPFKMWKCSISKNPDGVLSVFLPGRKSCGTSITAPEVSKAIKELALDAYHDTVA